MFGHLDLPNMKTGWQGTFESVLLSSVTFSAFGIVFFLCFFLPLLFLGIFAGQVVFYGYRQWNRVENHSSFKQLDQKHIELIASRQWQRVLSWIAFSSEGELLLLDHNRQSVLHHAILFRAPSTVIELLLFQAPELASISNLEGERALHWAVRLSSPMHVMKLLLEAAPDSALAEDQASATPLSLTWERHVTDFLETYRHYGRDCLLALPAWQRLLFFFQAAALVEDTADFRPLHAASRCRCPPALYPLLLQVYQKDLHQTDAHGQTPLLIACCHPQANTSLDVQTKIQLILAKDLSTMHSPCGRCALHTAAASGIGWDEGLADLFAAAPERIGHRSATTGLYPCLLAAAAKETREHQLTTVYQLIRADPAQVKVNSLG